MNLLADRPTFSGVGDTYLFLDVQKKRSAMARHSISGARLDKLQADLVHFDAVLRLYGLVQRNPKGRKAGSRSAYFLPE